VRFRVRQDGAPLGGPMVYLERGAYHPKLAKLFCVCCLLSSVGTGAMTQAGAIAEAVTAVVPLSPALIGTIVAFAVWPVLQGGSRLIAKTSSVLVPLMTLLYLAGGIAVLFLYRDRIVPSLLLILTDAVRPAAAGGGLLGILTARCVSDGFAKGIFSNEAGMGSAPIAHGCADSKSPCEEGVLGAVEVFVDTCVVCLLTALVILVSGTAESGAQGLALTTLAFRGVFGTLSGPFICVTVCFLAFSTIIGWSFYGLACLRYLTGSGRGAKLYLALVTLSVALSAFFPLNTMLLAADTAAALMAFPNLIGLWTLAPIVQLETQKYLRQK
ncbi:MAG: alanine/glycine:cation symporter family protein, partial [Intestinibacillus sp.]